MIVPRAERGFALVTAVVAMVLFALLILGIQSTARGTATSARATIVHAELAAAADAGLAIAAANLATDDRTRRWSIDGRERRIEFAGADVTIRVDDERGKVPINQITDEQVRAMFEVAGASGTALDAMVDGFLDWRDDDDDVRDDGAEAAYYAGLGIGPRNGALRSLEELRAIRGIDPATVEALRPFVSVFRDQREGFDETYAQPLALAVMSGGLGSPAAIQAAREAQGQRVAIDLASADSLQGRPLTVHVVARRGRAQVRRATMIEVTGAAAKPYVVRQRG